MTLPLINCKPFFDLLLSPTPFNPLQEFNVQFPYLRKFNLGAQLIELDRYLGNLRAILTSAPGRQVAKIVFLMMEIEELESEYDEGEMEAAIVARLNLPPQDGRIRTVEFKWE